MELKNIRGMGEKRIADLEKLNIKTAKDLYNHYPRGYLDMTNVVNIKDCYHNDFALIKATILTIPQSTYTKRGGYVKLLAVNKPYSTFTIFWFNQPYVIKKLVEGAEYLFYGRVQNKFNGQSMVNPLFEHIDENFKLKGIVPIYSLKGNLTQKIMRDSILNAIINSNIDSVIPKSIQAKYNLANLKDAYYKLNRPNNYDEIRLSSDRIALEEYFLLISAFKVIKGDRQQIRLNKYNVSAVAVREFTNRFEFEFTEGQKKAVSDIFKDVTSLSTMNRLLQGDVGSGKTAVSLTAIFMAVSSGYQVAFLAPTEILASQNFKLVKKYFPDINVEFLSGSTKASDKRKIKAGIKNGEIQIVIGTHAVIQKDVEFCNLAMCICDEQHRFGVGHRSSLVDKGNVPDLLVMSATPIPRTLSLIFYGDLDISTIKDKPKQRATIQTNIVPEHKYHDMLMFIKDHLKKGERAYFVCPKIEGDEEGAIMSAKETFEELQTVYHNQGVGLLHGKMKDTDKNQVMTDFKNGVINTLVSTTVIEVGIDVSEASIMVIYNAERFGLSQLHQLRGRVGRSNINSFCFLLSSSNTEKAIERLGVLKSTSDGFVVAEKDFDMRGGGDFLGTRQSGKFFSHLSNLKYSSSVIFLSKKISDEIFMKGENLNDIIELAKIKYQELKDIALN